MSEIIRYWYKCTECGWSEGFENNALACAPYIDCPWCGFRAMQVDRTVEWPDTVWAGTEEGVRKVEPGSCGQRAVLRPVSREAMALEFALAIMHGFVAEKDYDKEVAEMAVGMANALCEELKRTAP